MERLQSLKDHFQSKPAVKSFDNLPSFHELPHRAGLPGCAWDVWGKGDELGTVNLLTDEVVAQAAKEHIKTGKRILLNWPLNFPSKPTFGRREPEHKIISFPGLAVVNDDELHINTQSGTQWDGLRHFGIVSENCFYQGYANKVKVLSSCEKDGDLAYSDRVKVSSISKGITENNDPTNLSPEELKLGIHNWAQHGICGRGVLIDLVKFYTDNGKKPLPYDPWTTHPISVADIEKAAKQQGVTFRQGDILILRIGFMQKFNQESQATRASLQTRPETFAGIERSLEMKEFLWNNHFSAIASDQPALEAWPVGEGEVHLHQTILGLWGMPIGEFFDLEKLAEHANQTGRYAFFFSSWPLNVLGGVASPPNAAAIF